jgi:hypothetical protein
MKSFDLLCQRVMPLTILLLSASIETTRAELLAQWNFNSNPPDPTNNFPTGTTEPSFGSGGASVVGGATATFASGNGSTDPATVDDSAWNTATYPAQGTGNKTRGVQFSVSTFGFERIIVTWDQRNSSTASRYIRFQYSSDGTNFTDGPVFSITTQDQFFPKSVDLTAFPNVDNNSNFTFRIVSEFERTATLSGADAYVATQAGQTYGVTGTWRFDMVTVSGEVFTDNQFPVVSTISNQTIRVNTLTDDIPFTVGDLETPADQLLVNATSSDQTLVPDGSIYLGGTASNRTVTIVPASDQTGSATITITVTDSGGKFASTSFLLTVLPANTPPTISVFTNYHTLINAPLAPIHFTVKDAESGPADLTVTASSSNPVLVPDANLVLSGTGANRTLDVAPAAEETGNSVTTIAVSDGTLTTSRSFSVMVVPSTSVLLDEPFSYLDGPVTVNSGFRWSKHSGFDFQTQVTSGQLRLSSTQTEDINAVLIGGPYAPASGKTLYAGFTVNFSTLPGGAGEYFAHFRQVNGDFQARLFATTISVPPGFFHLGIANDTGNVTNAAMFPMELSPQTKYVVVIRYDVTSGISSLWVNPRSENDTSVVASDTPDIGPIGSWAFRQSGTATGSMGSLSIDDLRIAFSFADAVPGYRLRIRRVGPSLHISWPAAATDEAYVLERTADLNTSWDTVLEAPTRVGSRDEVDVPFSSVKQFYRLVK